MVDPQDAITVVFEHFEPYPVIAIGRLVGLATNDEPVRAVGASVGSNRESYRKENENEG
jgi:hypothetical protein